MSSRERRHYKSLRLPLHNQPEHWSKKSTYKSRSSDTIFV